jgi:2-polyprenyl-3-methyl-5-hydroxy-6-metoxy-1,4-benzoquinol methylase
LAEYEQAYAYGTGTLAKVFKLDEDGYGQNSLLRIPQHHIKMDRLIKAGAKGRLLEIGASTGHFLNEAKKRGFEVEGIEPGRKRCQTAKDQYDLNMHVGRVEDFEFAEESFDVVCSSHVFEHLLDPLAVAKKINSWLRMGGLHMIEVPNQFDNLVFKLRKLIGLGVIRERTFSSIHHPIFFSTKTLKKLVELSGCCHCSMRNVYYSSSNMFQDHKLSVRKLLGLISDASNIEIIARKTSRI